MWKKSLLTALCIVFCSSSYADNNTSLNLAPGAATKSWLELQVTGKQASRTTQVLSGPVSQKVLQRHQDSFTHPIPNKFTSKDSGSSSR